MKENKDFPVPPKLQEYLDSIATSASVVVFTFGHVYSGKTTFLLAMYQYLLRNYQVFTNPVTNPEGHIYLNRLLKTWYEEKSLPPQTNTINSWNQNKFREKSDSELGKILETKPREIDWEIIKDGKTYRFTFMDISGESFNILSDGTNRELTLSKGIEMFFQHKGMKIIILGFAPLLGLEDLPDYPEYEPLLSKDDKGSIKKEMPVTLFNHFLSYLADRYKENKKSYRLNNIAYIISKWDLHEKVNAKKARNAPKLDKDNIYEISAPLRGLKNRIDNPEKIPNGKRFVFSIGNINPKEQHKLVKNVLDTTYCKDIADWLFKTHDELTEKYKNHNKNNKRKPTIPLFLYPFWWLWKRVMHLFTDN